MKRSLNAAAFLLAVSIASLPACASATRPQDALAPETTAEHPQETRAASEQPQETPVEADPAQTPAEDSAPDQAEGVSVWVPVSFESTTEFADGGAGGGRSSSSIELDGARVTRREITLGDRSVTIDYAYDPDGSLVQASYGDDAGVRSVWTRTMPDDAHISWDSDAVLEGAGAFHDRRSYDDQGHLMVREILSPGDAAHEHRSIIYAYDESGYLTGLESISAADAAASRIMGAAKSQDGTLGIMRIDETGSWAASFTEDGQVREVLRSSGADGSMMRESYLYDVNGHLTGAGGGDLRSGAFETDESGNIVRGVISYAGERPFTQTYTVGWELVNVPSGAEMPLGCVSLVDPLVPECGVNEFWSLGTYTLDSVASFVQALVQQRIDAELGAAPAPSSASGLPADEEAALRYEPILASYRALGGHGYALVDLDGDGSLELYVASPDGANALYALVGGVPMLVIEGNDSVGFLPCADGWIYTWDRSDATRYRQSYGRIVDGSFVESEVLISSSGLYEYASAPENVGNRSVDQAFAEQWVQRHVPVNLELFSL